MRSVLFFFFFFFMAWSSLSHVKTLPPCSLLYSRVLSYFHRYFYIIRLLVDLFYFQFFLVFLLACVKSTSNIIYTSWTVFFFFAIQKDNPNSFWCTQKPEQTQVIFFFLFFLAVLNKWKLFMLVDDDLKLNVLSQITNNKGCNLGGMYLSNHLTWVDLFSKPRIF